MKGLSTCIDVRTTQAADAERATRLPKKNYITPAGYKALAEEASFLRWEKRPEVVSALADAAAEGDRSENAEYIYRKKQLRELDRRLRHLSKRIDLAFVVDPTEQRQTEKVFFGAYVTVEDEDGKEDVFRLVGVDEIEGREGAISWKSPVGRALLGRNLDDTVDIVWHAGRRTVTITDITYRR